MVKDRLLLWKLRRGDGEALRRVYEKYRRDLMGLAVTLSNDKAAAEDAVHDAFVSFVRFSPRLRLRTSLRSYLLTAVANRVRSLNRAGARRTSGPAEDSIEMPPPEHDAMRNERATLCRLSLFYRFYPPAVWEQIRKMKEAGQWVSEVAVTTDPYQEGDLWFVPVEIRSGSGESETQNAIVKFYEFEGKTLCFLIGSKEKGVVD